MPTELEFSIMAPGGDAIRPLLERFESETGIHVRLRLLAWDSAWSMFVRAALYNDGPDVSEVGTTWIGDLIGMTALRSFDMAEIASLGRSAAFLPAVWRTAVRAKGAGEPGERVWSVPWLTGARLIFYRPDLFERAGVDPNRAFQSNAALHEAVHRLYEVGVRIPWTVPTGNTHTSLLNVASWVWGAGGDFICADGRATAFTRPKSLAGLHDYFALGRYLAPEVRHLNGLEPDDVFINHPEAAMTISGPWLFCQARAQLGDLNGRIGVSLPPGSSFVGGSNLVVWKYTRNPEVAVKLVRFLTQHAAQVSYCQSVGLMPARIETVELAPFSVDPFWRTAVRGLMTGRSFPSIRLWGLVEDRLTAGLSAVWADVLAGGEIAPAIEKHLQPLAERLDQLLEKE